MSIRRLLGIVSLLALVSFAGGTSAHAQAANTFTLAPGGKATIAFTAFCLDFGVQFPANIQAPNDLAQDKVRAALSYAQSKNLTADQQQALEVQNAIWQLRGATNSPAGGDVTKAVVAAATTPPANPQGTSIVDAAKANQVRLTVNSWQPVGTKVQLGSASDNFYGQGTLTVENTSNQQVTLFMPLGAVFPPSTAGAQTMAGFATNVQVSNPQPQQLPTTGANDNILAIVLAVFALLLMETGIFLRARTRVR